MKRKLFSLLFGFFVTGVVNAQVPFVYYHPSGAQPSSPNQQRSTQSNIREIGAYRINDRGELQRIRIKINVVQDSYGGVEIWVRAYYNGYNWESRNDKAYAINEYSNLPSAIKNSFDWYCNGYPQLFFNY